MVCIPATKENGRFDVDQDGLVTWKDTNLIWEQRTSSTTPYDEYYDMNCDGTVNYQDSNLCWANRDLDAQSCEEIFDEQTCQQIKCYWYNDACHGIPNPAPAPEPPWLLLAIIGVCLAAGVYVARKQVY